MVRRKRRGMKKKTSRVKLSQVLRKIETLMGRKRKRRTPQTRPRRAKKPDLSDLIPDSFKGPHVAEMGHDAFRDHVFGALGKYGMRP